MYLSYRRGCYPVGKILISDRFITDSHKLKLHIAQEKLADKVLYQAKREFCGACGYTLKMSRQFCPICNSSDIRKGRNRIVMR